MEGSKTEAIVFTLLYSITILVSLVGNTFLIYMVWKRPDVRSLTSFMFVNMAVADLLVTLVMMPWSIAFFYTNAQWLITGTFGDFTCRVVIFRRPSLNNGIYPLPDLHCCRQVLCDRLSLESRYMVP